jgi:hypothetical protein
MDLFAKNLDEDPSTAQTKDDKKHMNCTLGCDFDKGSGIYIESSHVITFLAVNGSSRDHRDGTTIHANIFNPM